MRGTDGWLWIGEKTVLLIGMSLFRRHTWMPLVGHPHQPPVDPHPMICVARPVELPDYYIGTYMPCQLVGAAPDTLAAYRTALNHWSRWPDRQPMASITSKTLARFAAWMLPGLSPASVNSYMNPIKAILRYAADEDDIEQLPRFRCLRAPKRVPLAFTKEEFSAVLQAARKERGQIGGIRASLWWPSFLCADFESGLRVSAQLSVRTTDMLLDQGGFFCQAENQKDREADWYPLSPGTIELIKAIYDSSRQQVWPLDMSQSNFYRRFRRIMERAGIYAPKGASMAFHRIRKSTASYIAVAGGNPQQKLGHSSPKVTQHYLDPRIVRANRNTDLVPAPTSR